jgi:1-acyl-sn-glycerol-3-phosphate acyltransferase
VVSLPIASADVPVAAKRTNSLVVACYRWIRTCVHALEGVATTLFVFPLVSEATRRTVVQRWSLRLLRILAVEVRIEGDIGAHRGNVMVVANHISWLDIFVLNAVHPVRFVAKSELSKWPVISQMIRGAGTVFIVRERPRDVVTVNHYVARLLAQGNLVAIFPEGTTTYGNALLPFKSALLQPVVEAEGHVQPMVIRYRTPDGKLSFAPEYVGDTSFATSFWRVCSARALTVQLIARPPVAARGRHRRDVARAAEASIRTALAAPASAREPDTASDPEVALR